MGDVRQLQRHRHERHQLIDVTMNLTGPGRQSRAAQPRERVSSARSWSAPSPTARSTIRPISLTSTEGISDWYAWFFEEIERASQACCSPDLPIYNNPTVRVVLTGTGTATMECGNLVAGQQKDLGRTLHDGAQVGIIDYSRKEADAFGNYTIVERAFSKRGSFKMRIAKARSTASTARCPPIAPRRRSTRRPPTTARR
jgi:hypothetical protein